MVLQDNGNVDKSEGKGRAAKGTALEHAATALRRILEAARRACDSAGGLIVRGTRTAGSAIAKCWRTVVSALNPNASSNLDAKQVFRIRRTVVFSGIAAVVLIVAVIVAVSVHANRSAQADKTGTVVSAQTSKTKQSPSAKATKKTTAGKTAAENSSAKKTQEQSDTSSSSTDETKRQVEALAASISDDESATIKAKADETAHNSGKPVTQYTYCIAGKGNVGVLDGFANTVYRVLNDPRGWPRAGATFVKGDGDACNFTVVLSEAKYMQTFDSGCSAEYSCRVGDNVIINLDRWNGGIGNWMEAGGNLARYRTMVINHEVGHALGHIDNETTCAGAGKPAPLMQEQSMHLDGCTVNEWPLDDELWRS
jgi:hypothetical protein